MGMSDFDAIEFLVNAIILPNPVAAISLAVAISAFVLNFFTRRSQKSARIVVELLPQEKGVYLLVTNVGDRIAYNCELSIQPTDLNPALQYLSVIAPQRSFGALLCPYDEVPRDRIQVDVKYNDPAHKSTRARDRASFDTSSLDGSQVATNEELGCHEERR